MIHNLKQSWSIFPADSILIFDSTQIQKRLYVKLHKKSLTNIEPGSGKLIDEYFIDKLNRREMELSTHQTIDEGAYTVRYYLERLEDTSQKD